MSAPLRSLLLLLSCLWLGGCQLWPTTPAAAPEAPPALPPEPVRDVIAEIRAQAAQLVSSVEIVPVENPAISVLLDAARQDLASGDLAAAQRQIEIALELEPDNPRVLQELAELHLQGGHHPQAAELAQRSYARSAQLGELCARNWLTLAEVKRAAGEDAQVQIEQALACGVQPVPRL